MRNGGLCGFAHQFIAQVDERRVCFEILGKGVADGVCDHEEHQVAVCKTHFALGRVDVDVEFHVRHVQEQHRNGLALGTVGFVGLRNRLAHHLVFDGAVSHKEELVVALAVRFCSGGDVSAHMDARFGVIDREQAFGHFGADGFGDTAAELARYARKDGPVAYFIVKSDFGVRNSRLDDNV